MIQVRDGQSVRFDCTFYHQGGGYSGAKLHCAIGVQNAIFNEKIAKDSLPLSVSYDEGNEQYQESVVVGPIKVGGIGGLAPGRYESYVKLMSIPGGDLYWNGPLDDIEIISAEAIFSNLSVNYSTT